MDTETPLILHLLPTIHVLIGGIVGIIGALSAKYIGFKLEQKKEERTLYREKLERAYIVLEKIRYDYLELTKNCVLKLNHGREMQINKTEVPSPLHELAMLTKLYMPSLLDTHENFQELIYSYGGTLASVISVKIHHLDKSTNRNLIAEVKDKMLMIENEINSFQNELTTKMNEFQK